MAHLQGWCTASGKAFIYWTAQHQLLDVTQTFRHSSCKRQTTTNKSPASTAYYFNALRSVYSILFYRDVFWTKGKIRLREIGCTHCRYSTKKGYERYQSMENPPTGKWLSFLTDKIIGKLWSCFYRFLHFIWVYLTPGSFHTRTLLY